MKSKNVITTELLMTIVFSLLFSFFLASCGNEMPELVSVDDILIVDGGTFLLSDYRNVLVEFEEEKTTNNIDDGEDAVEAAVTVWRDMYYYEESKKPNGRPHDPLQLLEKIVFKYDAQNECWLVYGEFPESPPVAGVRSHMIIKSDGTVLAVWLE